METEVLDSTEQQHQLQFVGLGEHVDDLHLCG